MNTINISDKYFLNNENIYKLNQKINTKKNITKRADKTEKITKEKPNTCFFCPEPEDSLLWCWIIFHEGIKEYYIQTEFSMLKNLFTYEKQNKIQLISILRQYKKILKQHKMKINDIENNLMYENTSSLDTIISLCIVHSYNIIVLHDKIYWDKIICPGNKTLCIKKENDKYSIHLEKFDIFNLKQKRIVVDNINKPLKAISSYKVDEIRELCGKFDINIMKSPNKYKTKKDLYLLLQEQF